MRHLNLYCDIEPLQRQRKFKPSSKLVIFLLSVDKSINMSDLEDDLLALAGAGSEEEEQQRYDSASDSDIPLKRKTKGGASDAKRQKVSSEEDEEDEDDEEEEDEEQLTNPYPLEGKYKDEDDREELLELDEMEREQILFERTQEMEKYNERKYLAQRMRQQKQTEKLKQRQLEGKKTRSSNRTKTTTSAKSSKLDKLSELRKQREQKTSRSRRRDEDFSGDEDEDEEEEDEDEGIEEDEDEDEENDYEEGEVVWGSGKSKSKFKTKSYEIAKYEDIIKIKIGRSILHKYCFYSDFNDTIIDTYGKINLGVDKKTKRPIYRMVQIIDIKNHPNKPYNLPGFKTDIYLLVSQNKNQQKEFPINIFSDSPISPEEFERYKFELSKTNEEFPYADDVNEKYEQLQHLINRGVSDKDVNEIIERKKKLKGNIQAYDAVFEKAKILDKLTIAQQQNNAELVKKLNEELRNLEDVLINQTQQNAFSKSLSTMSKVNERNRKLNQENIRKAELKSSHLKKLVEQSDGDPFSRLKTQTRVFYQDLLNQENAKAIDEAKSNYDKLIEEKAKIEEKIATSTYRVLGNMDKIIREIDVKIDLQL